MIETAIIFSKETGEIILSSVYGKIEPNSDDFIVSKGKIKEIAIKLEKGIFNLDLDDGLIALIIASKRIAVALIFTQVLDKKTINEWEKVAREIINGFEKIYDPHDLSKQAYFDYKKIMDEIIEWQLKQESPIDKMKDALW